MSNYINKLKRYVCRKFDLHPSSYPFISGDSFRHYANHVVNSEKYFDTDLIKKGDVVFIGSINIVEYFKKIHPKIREKYKLISHSHTFNTDSSFSKYIDEKIIHWYAKNGLFEHKKFTPLPLGLENQWYYHAGDVGNFKKLRKKHPEQKTAILYRFSASTNETERIPALQQLEEHPLAETFAEWLQPIDYLKKLQTYKFVCSPPGFGEDCHRTWEAMYLGVVPIVKRSVMTEYFAELGLPIHIVNDWSELATLDETTLSAIYELHKDSFDHHALWANYWFDKIKNVQKYDA